MHAVKQKLLLSGKKEYIILHMKFLTSYHYPNLTTPPSKQIADLTVGDVGQLTRNMKKKSTNKLIL